MILIKILVKFVKICLKLAMKITILPLLVLLGALNIVVELIMNTGKFALGLVNLILVIGTVIMFASGMCTSFLIAVVTVIALEAVFYLTGGLVSSLSEMFYGKLINELVRPVVLETLTQN